MEMASIPVFKPKEKSNEILQKVCTLKCYFWIFEMIWTDA